MLAVDDCEGCSNTPPSAHSQADSVSSEAHTSALLSSVLSHTLVATEPSFRRHKKRGSLSALIGILPKDITLLISSHSYSRRLLRDIHASDSDMLQDDERPTRKTFRENKLYRFITRSLTRSRSRSRSRTGRDTLPTVVPSEPVPGLPLSQNGRARLDSMGQTGSSKPVTRIPSRPLSSTTTVTNTTITPATLRAKKRPPSGIPVPKASKARPETTKTPPTRKKLHTLFGIPLSSPKKSFFTPSNHDRPPPPLLPRRDEFEENFPIPKGSQSLHSHSRPPGHDEFEENVTTSKAFRSQSQPRSRPESPNPTARPKLGRNTSSGSAGTYASGSSRLQKLFNGGSKTPPPPSADVVSSPINRPSVSSHRRGNSASNRSSPSSTPDIAPSKPKAVGLMRPPAIPPPHSAHVPPNPQQERPGPGPQIGKSLSRGHSSSRNTSVDSSCEAEGVDGLGNLNGHTRVKMGHSRRHSRQSTKHGSFDFERPGWNTIMQRTASVETTGSETSTTGTHLGRGFDGFVGGIRESVMGPGLAGVGTLQKNMSLKRGKEREEMIARIKEEERRRRRAEAQAKEKTMHAQEFGVLPSQSQSSSPEDDRAPATGKVSTCSKKYATFPEKAKVTALGASLGPFEFEPPVSPPVWSTASTGNGRSSCREAPVTVSWASEKGRDKSRTKADLGHIKARRMSREKERRPQSAHQGVRAPVPVPDLVTSPSIGYRSGMKGRSLDLGLDLSWAPSSVREDALLPSSVLISRSVSRLSSHASRSVGKSVSGLTSGHGTIENPVLASEVAKVFRSTLDDKGYERFKQYVDRFDAGQIPIDGPIGIVAHVERLLTSTPGLNEEDKRQLLSNFVRVVLQYA